MTISYCLRFETSPIWRARSPYLYLPGTGWVGYNPRHWVLFTSPPTTHRTTVESLFAESSLMLWPTTVHRLLCLIIKHQSEAYAQIFITVRQLRVCLRGALSLTRGRACRLQLLPAIASAVILESESQEIRDHILLSQIQDFPFRRILWLAGLRWRYSTPPPHGVSSADRVQHTYLIGSFSVIHRNCLLCTRCLAVSGTCLPLLPR
jgi:hypothetical protein